MSDNLKNENLDICSECGGRCCNKCGCDYAIVDFRDRTYKGLLEALAKGDKSIVAALDFKTMPSGKFIATPFLYLRARNTDRDIVDLVSMKTRCSLLNYDGCSHDYENRPFGGRNLIPSRKEDGPCMPDVEPLDYLMAWSPYQKQLRKIVKHYTGMSVEEKVSQDVENLFYDALCRNYKGVHPAEMDELKEFIPLLVRAFPEERQRAVARKNGSELKVFRK